jgi:hypothetical protein
MLISDRCPYGYRCYRKWIVGGFDWDYEKHFYGGQYLRQNGQSISSPLGNITVPEEGFFRKRY